MELNLTSQQLTDYMASAFVKSVDATTKTLLLCCPVCTKRYKAQVTMRIHLPSKSAAEKFNKFHSAHEGCSEAMIEMLLDRAFKKYQTKHTVHDNEAVPW